MDISFLLWLQGIRESAPSFIQGFFNVMGLEALIGCFIVLPCVIYWCVDKKSGQFALLAYSASSACNQLIKNTVCAYRPWLRDARITPNASAIQGADGYSFPSGHSQSSSSLVLGLVWQKRHAHPVLTAVAGIFVALVVFSRLFLGVHAPQDVLVGLLEGFGFVLLADRLVPWLEEKEGRDIQALVVGCILTAAFLVYITVKPYHTDYVDGKLLVDPVQTMVSCYKSGGLFVGVLAGWVVERRYVCFDTDGISMHEGALRLVVGIVVLLLVYVVLGRPLTAMIGENIGQFIRHVAVFFMITAGVPALFEPIGRAYVKLS